MCSTRLKSIVGLGPRILSLQVYDRESLISFHVQAVVPLILVKPIDTSPHASLLRQTLGTFSTESFQDGASRIAADLKRLVFTVCRYDSFVRLYSFFFIFLFLAF